MRLAATPSEIGSSPANGSSYMISSGSSAIARARATRRAIPPDRSAGFNCAAPRSPTAFSFISTRSRIIGSGSVVCSRSGNATLSNTVMSVNSAPNWNSMPTRRRSAYNDSRSRGFTGDPSNDTVPRCGVSVPPIRRSSVVLPHPDPPMIAMTLPRGKVIVMSDRMTRWS